jgi:hypothetical protein
MSTNRQLIFDTSVWIDFFRGRNSPESLLLSSYIKNDDPVVLVPMVIQEILQGIRDDRQFKKIREILSYLTVLHLPPENAAIGAAQLYRSLRKKGVTVRKSNDCLIAYYAVEFSMPLVHIDGDFDLISRQSKLKIWIEPRIVEPPEK